MMVLASCIKVVKMITLVLICSTIGDPNIEVNTNIPDGEPGSCYPIVLGCNDFSAFNYNDYDGDGLANAITGIDGIDVNTDDGSCIPKVYGCMTEGFFNYNPLANIDTEVCYL